jgi:hypothetical protein
MNKLLLVFLLSYFSLNTFAQSENPSLFPVFSDIEIANFKSNNIKTISKYEMIKDEKGVEEKKLNEKIIFNDQYQIIAWQSKNNFTQSIENFEYFYEQNKLIKRVKKINSAIIESIDLKYDEKNRLKNYITSNEKNRLYTNLYRYDENGNISAFKVLRYTSYGMHLQIIEKKYSIDNLLEQEDIYEVKGEGEKKLSKQIFYTYDGKLLIQKQEVNNANDEDFIEKYRYNDKNQIAEVGYFSDNKKQYSITYEYDVKNKIIKQENKDAENKIIFSIVNEYNANERLIKTIEKSKDNIEVINTYNSNQLLSGQTINKNESITTIKIEYQ